MPEPKPRHLGVDALRIVSMLMVVGLHMYTEFGLQPHFSFKSPPGAAAWLLYLFMYCAANCFGMISGYVGVKQGFRPSKALSLVLQVGFIHIAPHVIALLWRRSFSLRGLYQFMLTAPATYWYATAYFALLFFQPALSAAIQAMSRRQFRALLVAMAILFCLLKGDPFHVQEGFSTLWLIAMYFFGGYVRRFESEFRWKPWQYALAAGLTVAAEFASLAVSVLLRFPLDAYFVRYNSLPALLCAFFLLLAFAKIRTAPRVPAAVTRYFAPAAFGVYLIHRQPEIRALIERLSALCQISPSLLFLFPAACAFTLAVFLACALVERLRLRLFRVLRIDRLPLWTERNLNQFIKRKELNP